MTCMTVVTNLKTSFLSMDRDYYYLEKHETRSNITETVLFLGLIK